MTLCLVWGFHGRSPFWKCMPDFEEKVSFNFFTASSILMHCLHKSPPSCCRKLEFIVPGSTNHQVELLHCMNLLGNGIIYQMGGIKWVGVSDASTAHETTGHNPIQGSRLLQHSTNKTLQHLYRFQVIRGPQNSKKRTKRGPNFEQKGDPKGAQMET